MNSFFPETSAVVSHQGAVSSSMNSLKFKGEHKETESYFFKKCNESKIVKTK